MSPLRGMRLSTARVWRVWPPCFEWRLTRLMLMLMRRTALAQAHPSARAQSTQTARANRQQPPEAREVLVALYQAGCRLRIAVSHPTEQRLPKGN